MNNDYDQVENILSTRDLITQSLLKIPELSNIISYVLDAMEDKGSERVDHIYKSNPGIWQSWRQQQIPIVGYTTRVKHYLARRKV
jgi:hypothetical protein